MKNPEILKGLHFAIFALGSSMYEKFCEFGKFCHNSIASLGGRKLADLGLGDDQADQENAFQEWAQVAVLNAFNINKITMSTEMHSNWPFQKSFKKHLKLNGHMDSPARGNLFLVTESLLYTQPSPNMISHSVISSGVIVFASPKKIP